MSDAALTLDGAHFDAVLFDLDGVITGTARQHARSWKRMFDEYLQHRSLCDDGNCAPFDAEADYRRYVDGKPRYEGVAGFLRSRGIELPRGDPCDPAGAETLCGLGNRKNELFRALLDSEGADVYAPAMALVRRLRSAGIRTAVVSSSRNCEAILKSVGAFDLFDVRVDGDVAQARDLRGKPQPDTFLAAAAELKVSPERAAVFEDAEAGVAAGRAGGFGLVVGVAREGQADELLRHGADIALDDLSAVDVRP